MLWSRVLWWWEEEEEFCLSLSVAFTCRKLKWRLEPQAKASIQGKECSLLKFFSDLTVCLYNTALQLCLQVSKFLLESTCCCLCACMSTCHCRRRTRRNPVSSASTVFLLNSGWDLCLEGFWIKVLYQEVPNKRPVQNQSNRNSKNEVFSWSSC